MSELNPGNRTGSVVALCLAILGAAATLYYHQAIFVPQALSQRAATGLGNGYSFGNDFYQIWLTSREWKRHGHDPYGAETTREIQTGLYGRPLDPSIPTDPLDQRRFPYPAFANTLFWPAAELPFPVARFVLLCCLTPLTVATVLLWLRVFRWPLSWHWKAVIVLLTLCSYPVLEALYAVQVGLIVSFLLAASMLALQRERFLFAGFLSALSTIKPQVILLVVLYALVWSLHNRGNRVRYCAGFFLTLGLLVAAALAVQPDWIQSWIRTLLAYHQYTPPSLVTEVLTSPLGRASGPATFLLVAGSMIFAIMLVWRNRATAATSFEFQLTVSILLAITTISLLSAQAVYDHLILLPGVILLLRHRREISSAGRVPHILLVLSAIVLFWPWAAAMMLIALRPLMPATYLFNSAVFALPIRTAASLPFAVLALLFYAMRITTAERQESS